MKVLLALGSNVGDRLANLRSACSELQSLSLTPLRRSCVYDTVPEGCPPGSSNFLNAAVVMEVEDSTSPHDLLGKLQVIERKLGRQPEQVHNEPRPIDLDLISCGGLRVNTLDLILPHPRAHLRRFVLQPLSDLSPDLVLPGQTKAVWQLLDDLPARDAVKLFTEVW